MHQHGQKQERIPRRKGFELMEVDRQPHNQTRKPRFPRPRTPPATTPAPRTARAASAAELEAGAVGLRCEVVMEVCR